MGLQANGGYFVRKVLSDKGKRSWIRVGDLSFVVKNHERLNNVNPLDAMLREVVCVNGGRFLARAAMICPCE